MKARLLAALAIVALVAVAGGCSTIGYYYQAARGHLTIVHAARPVDAWLADPKTPTALRTRLEAARDIRDFAVRELGLPDNDSYRSYAELGRPFVVWNVVAAAEFSTRPREWCFPVAGCVAYKGWYAEGDAEQLATALREEGFDAFVHGVPAYSTLGWFDDPLLSSFLRYPRAEVARLVFHELAHQVAYAPGDSAFNEALATAVELEGVRRWLARVGTPSEQSEFDAMTRRKRDFVALIQRTRARLDALYDLPLPPDEMRRRKALAFQGMRDDYAALKVSWAGFAGYDRWFAQALGNAHLASIGTYEDALPALDALLDRVGRDLPTFYAEAKRLAKLDTEARSRALGIRTGETGE
jgi:predicted aminopeptidase